MPEEVTDVFGQTTFLYVVKGVSVDKIVDSITWRGTFADEIIKTVFCLPVTEAFAIVTTYCSRNVRMEEWKGKVLSCGIGAMIAVGNDCEGIEMLEEEEDAFEV